MNPILSESALAQWHSLTGQAQQIVITAHINPDGDALGASLAMAHHFRRMGKQAQVVLPNVFPDFLQWMPGAADVLIGTKTPNKAAKLIAKADLIIVADMSTSSRLGGIEQAVLESPAPRILIDHHLNPGNFCTLTLSRPEMCATAELWCHLLIQLGQAEALTLDEATCIYAGIMTDTGNFSYNSNRPEIYTLIPLLLAKGIDKDQIYRNTFWSFSPQRLRLMGYLLHANMELLCHNQASLITLSNVERRHFSILNGETEGFVNLPLQTKGMKLSVFLAQDTDHPEIIKVSLRSVGSFPCHEMAQQYFNGGGHANASGGRLKTTMDEAIQIAHKAISEYAPLLK